MVANTLFKGAAVLLAATNVVFAAGNAIVHNQCDFDVYLWSVSDAATSMTTIEKKGGEYAEAYQLNPNGGGISLKVGRDMSGKNITQYEYTLKGDSLWYDLSLIDGHPFIEHGVSIIPSDDDCRAVICPAGVELCAAAYMIPTDNWATAHCGSDADTVLILCSGDEDTDGSAAVTSIASSAIATADPITVVAATTDSDATTTKAKKNNAQSTKLVYSAWTWGNREEENHAYTTTAAAVTTAPAVFFPNNVVIHTTFVTYVVTVEARDESAAPTAAATEVAKRQIHRHEHGQRKRTHEHVHVHA